MGAVIAALFVWASLAGVNQSPSSFYITPLTLGLALASMAIAILSYVIKPEQLRAGSALAAYILLLVSIGMLVMQTGFVNSPFIALWLVVVTFVGVFGPGALAALFTIVVGANIYLILEKAYGNEILVSVALTTVLPIIVSYILWHERSKTDKSKDRAYYDLANELNQVANKSEVVINAISDGVLAINNQGVIELINPAAQRIVGWGHQDALGLDYKSVLQLLTKDGHELDKSNDPIFDVLSTNQPVRRDDLQLQTSSGKKLIVELVVSPIGRIGSGAIIVFRDITKEQAEENAQAEFISTASHEMRTPVASIEGYLGLALNPATATIDAKARDFITKAHESAQHLGRLFQDLLDVTKADDGRLSNNPKVINVVEFAATIVEGLQPKAEEKGLRIFFKPNTAKDNEEGGLRSVAPVYYVDLDNDHLREVLANLVENAIKYTLKGEVVVDVQGDNDHVVISITDSGIGIPAEDIPHLFQKFYRVDNSDTREIGGTGLGLYLCRRLVETMGGRIWVESEYKKGSTFYVELPRISHEEASRLIEAAAARAEVPERTIVGMSTEDDAEIQAAHTTALNTPIILGRRPITTTANASSSPEGVIDPLMGKPSAPPAAIPSLQHGATQPPAQPPTPPAPQPQPAPVQAPQPSAPASVPKPPTPAPAPVVTTPSAQPQQPAPVSAPAPAPTPAPQPTVQAAPTPAPATAAATSTIVVPKRQ